MIYKTLVGLKADLSPAEIPEILANKLKIDNRSTKERNDTCTSSENSDDSNNENESEISNEDNKSKFVNSARPRNESPESRKVRYILFIFLCIMFNFELINLSLCLILGT